MSGLFVGLGALSLPLPLPDRIHRDLTSVFLLLFVFLAVLALAHYTNPPESSFRSFLTEQSFRQHLSRLDDSDSDTAPATVNATARPPTKTDDFSLPHVHKGLGYDRPLHFASRASVSLRTPKHVLHSFGILTIASVVPDERMRAARSDCSACISADYDGSAPSVANSWFVGAFGRWWRGGVVDAWWLEAATAKESKGEEGWSSGILRMKHLDKPDAYNTLPFHCMSPDRLLARITSATSSHQQAEPARPAPSSGHPPKRSVTPPPLPKSASLPFHSTPGPQPNGHQNGHHAPLSVPVANGHTANGAPSLSRTPSSLDQTPQTPMIAELLRQITESKTTIQDLRGQLTAFQTSASEAHAVLQSDLDEHRENKRREEAARSDLKARTKNVEDSKRAADSAKRDVERRLKATQTQREHADMRIITLEKEIGKMKARLAHDEQARESAREEAERVESEMAEGIERQKREIKEAEEVVAGLGAQTRELESKIAEKKERLNAAREKADLRRQDRTFLPQSHQHQQHAEGDSPSNWAPITAEPERMTDSPPQTEQSAISQTSPRPKRLSLGGISNFNQTEPIGENSQIALRAKGYAIFDEDIASLQQHQARQQQQQQQQQQQRFIQNSQQRSAGFLDMTHPTESPLTPMSSSLIPNSLIQSLEGAASDAFCRSDDDPIVAPDNNSVYPTRRRSLNSSSGGGTSLELARGGALNVSDISLVLPGPNTDDYDPFEIRVPLGQRQAFRVDELPFMDHSRPPPSPEIEHAHASEPQPPVLRRWFSGSISTSKRGLNPDAKVFSFTKKKAPSLPPAPLPIASGPQSAGASSAFDRLNPSATIQPSTGGPASAAGGWSAISMHAFAPSPAEREALQRALGTTSNTSLERLPSLPATPSLAQSQPVIVEEPKKERPSWLAALPLGRFAERGAKAQSSQSASQQDVPPKPKFSPWEDEEGELASGAAAEAE